MKDDIDETILEEACYYLSKLGLSKDKIANAFNISEKKVKQNILSYSRKIKEKKVTENEFDILFWERVKREAEGDKRVTFVSRDGFHHSWKSELEKLDGETLMGIYEASKDFLNTDPNSRFVEYARPKGYDPIALEREIKYSIEIISKILESKYGKNIKT